MRRALGRPHRIGAPRARLLAVHRWVQRDPIARAWYQSKKARDGGRASRAVVAMMRKLAKALFHVGRGAEFDSTKLFDIKRLGVA